MALKRSTVFIIPATGCHKHCGSSEERTIHYVEHSCSHEVLTVINLLSVTGFLRS